MIDAARDAGVQLVVGHSHSFDAPILRAREIIASGSVGAVRMIQALNYTDFLYRPRRPEELDTAQGGGVLFSQAAHQIDIVRLLGGGLVRSVRAGTGAWDPRGPPKAPMPRCSHLKAAPSRPSATAATRISIPTSSAAASANSGFPAILRATARRGRRWATR